MNYDIKISEWPIDMHVRWSQFLTHGIQIHQRSGRSHKKPYALKEFSIRYERGTIPVQTHL